MPFPLPASCRVSVGLPHRAPGRATALAAVAALGWFAVAPPAAAQPAEMPPEFTIETSGWEGGAVGEPGTGQFSHCGISREYNNGVTLIFSLGLSYDTNIVLTQPDWALEEGQEQEVRLRVDQTIDGTGPAIAVAPTVLFIPLGEDDQILEVMKRGSTLTLDLSEGSFQFPLTGTLNALTAMRDCVDTAHELIAAAPQQAQAGFGAAATTPAPASSFGMTLGGLRGLLDAAGLDAGDSLRFFWRLGTVIGGLHQQPRLSEAVEIDAFADSYMALLAARCPGDLISDVQPAEIHYGVYAVKQATARCEVEGSPQELALLFTLDDAMYSVFFHQTDEQDAAIAREATDSLYRVIHQMVASPEAEADGFDTEALIDQLPVENGADADVDEDAGDDEAAEEN